MIATAFYSNPQFINYALETGEVIKFVNHLFYTTKQHVIDELNKVVDKGHPDIYIKKGEETVDTEALTPEAQLEKRLRAKIMAEMATATQHDRDLGSYDTAQAPDTMLTTRTPGQAGNPLAQKTVIPTGEELTGLLTQMSDAQKQELLAKLLPSNSSAPAESETPTVTTQAVAGNTATTFDLSGAQQAQTPAESDAADLGGEGDASGAEQTGQQQTIQQKLAALRAQQGQS